MLLIIAVAIVSTASLVITFFLTDRSYWRKLLLSIGIAGAALSGLQAYNNRQRADSLAMELDRLKAPRTLTTEQKGRVVEKMSPFAGTMFDFGATSDTETIGVVDLIEDLLKTAGWMETNWRGTQTLSRLSTGREVGMIVSAAGVQICVEMEQEGKLLPIAKALASALSLEGISADAKFLVDVPTDNHNAIHILVGSKS